MFWLGVAIAAVAFAALLWGIFLLIFHRDPERDVPEGPDIVSPADGKVLAVMDWPAGAPVELRKGVLGRLRALTEDLDPCPHVIIPIFMSPLDVHVQRIPVAGTVDHVVRHPGGFLMATSLDALENATVETLLTTPVGKVKVLQTAGILVRHIHNRLTPGQSVVKGERFGKIDFGSQVTVILPKRGDLHVRVKPGDHVYAGETILAQVVARSEPGT
jgi:phosphatidylserine decarboxylase